MYPCVISSASYSFFFHSCSGKLSLFTCLICRVRCKSLRSRIDVCESCTQLHQRNNPNHYAGSMRSILGTRLIAVRLQFSEIVGIRAVSEFAPSWWLLVKYPPSYFFNKLTIVNRLSLVSADASGPVGIPGMQKNTYHSHSLQFNCFLCATHSYTRTSHCRSQRNYALTFRIWSASTSATGNHSHLFYHIKYYIWIPSLTGENDRCDVRCCERHHNLRFTIILLPPRLLGAQN